MTSGSADAVDAFLSLRQHSADGHRKPHKPLLVLLALDRLMETGSSQLKWSETETKLSELIKEFGPPSSTNPSQAAAYPFTHLRSDGVWVLDADVPMDRISPLREEDVSGRFPEQLERHLLSQRDQVPEIARSIAESQFPVTLVPDVLSACGFGPDSMAGSGRTESQAGRRRSAAWRDQVLRGWDYQCAFCGYDGRLGVGPVGLDAAHVRWFNFEGPDDLDNGLALCSLHHKLLDRGAIGLQIDGRILISQLFSARSGSGRAVYGLHGQLLKPRPGTPLPNAQHVQWHTEEVFKGDPLVA